MDNRLEVRTLLSCMRETASIAQLQLLIYLIAVTGLGTLFDLARQASGSTFFDTINSTVAGYLLLRSVLLTTGLAKEGELAGFGAYFGLSILSGLGILLGLVLLIVPGVILIVRWTAAASYLLCENSRIGDALGESFKMTKGNFWPLFGVGLLGAVPPIIGVLAIGVFTGDTEDIGTGVYTQGVANMATNALTTATSAYFVIVGVAAYKLLFRAEEGIVEVFA